MALLFQVTVNTPKPNSLKANFCWKIDNYILIMSILYWILSEFGVLESRRANCRVL